MQSISVGLDPAAADAFLWLVLATPSLDFGPWVSAGRRVARLEELVDDIDGANIEIAAELQLSRHTVHDHVRSVFDRLAVSSRQQLALRLLT